MSEYTIAEMELNNIADYQAQLAERDAEIAQLRKRVAEADQIVRAGEAERKALAAQVAELQANNAALTAQVSQWLDDDDDAEDWHGRTGHDVM